MEIKHLMTFLYFFFKEFLYFLFSVSLIFFVGLYDDKFTLSPFTRLLVITFSIYLILKTDDTLLLKELLFSFSNLSLQINSLAFPFTLLCFISLILALNMFDGINLQSGILFFIFFICCCNNKEYFYFTFINFNNYISIFKF